MGYTITIGNAVPVHSKEYGELYARWAVEGATVPEAPAFPNDVAQHTNSRSPSYTTWSDFAHAVGLHDLFYDRDEGLLRNHPGCVMLTPEIGAEIRKAVERYPRTKPPGFATIGHLDPETKRWVQDDADTYDGHLARLLWLDFWVQWALTNCETPALENT